MGVFGFRGLFWWAQVLAMAVTSERGELLRLQKGGPPFSTEALLVIVEVNCGSGVWIQLGQARLL